MSKKLRLPILLLIAVIAAGAWYYYQHLTLPTGQITLYGNVELRQVSLAFNNSERILELNVEEGDPVTKGQVLGQLDTKTLLARIEQAKAQIRAQQAVLSRLKNGSRPEEIAQAKAILAATKADADNSKALFERFSNIAKTTNGQGVSKQDVDTARAAYQRATAQQDNAKKALELVQIGPRIEDIEQAKAQLQVANAELAILQQQLEYSTLIAPVDATVRSRLLEPGDMASPARSVFTLAITDPKWVRAYIPETELGRVKSGMQASVIMDSAPNNPFTGQVGFISSNAEFTPKNVQTEELRTSLVYEIRIYLKDPDNRLKLGMPVTVRLDATDSHE